MDCDVNAQRVFAMDTIAPIEPKKNKKSNEETKKTKTEMLRRNGPVMKSVESVLRPKESLW